ncbi:MULTISPECIES: WGxxGxxG family protein [Paenibacillus]|uniref:WGxxGxxG family protein n=1 Tax=Paenibacillus residui TaxID=629724 RepID=A0ABW3DAX2_9BACL|nr:WGxxGxxG family protein [Paenibacillus sp. 32O-W]
MNKGLGIAVILTMFVFAVPADAAGTTDTGAPQPGTTTVNTNGTYTGAQDMSGNANYPGSYGKYSPGINTPSGLNGANVGTTDVNRVSGDMNGNGTTRSTYTNQIPGRGNGTGAYNMSTYRTGAATRADNTMNWGWLGLLGLLGLAGLGGRNRGDQPQK